MPRGEEKWTFGESHGHRKDAESTLLLSGLAKCAKGTGLCECHWSFNLFLTHADVSLQADSNTAQEAEEFKKRAEDLKEDELMDLLSRFKKKDRNIPKIIYASRTHSQISQAIQELKRSGYGHMRAAVIGSRDQLCINTDVMKETTNAAKVRYLTRVNLSLVLLFLLHHRPPRARPRYSPNPARTTCVWRRDAQTASSQSHPFWTLRTSSRSARSTECVLFSCPRTKWRMLTSFLCPITTCWTLKCGLLIM